MFVAFKFFSNLKDLESCYVFPLDDSVKNKRLDGSQLGLGKETIVFKKCLTGCTDNYLYFNVLNYIHLFHADMNHCSMILLCRGYQN